MARIKQTKTASPGITLPIIVVIYKTTAPSAEYARLVIPTPHSAPYNYEFSNIDPAVYNVKHYSSVDGVALSTLLADFTCNAVTNQVLSERRYYTVGGPGATDPGVGSTITDSYLDGKNVTGVFKEGFRYLKPVDEWSQTTGGVINLLGGLSLNIDEVISVEIEFAQNLTPVPQNDTFSTIVTLTGDTSLTASDYNKAFFVRATANKQTTTLPLVGTVPDGKGFLIRHDRGNAINVVVKAQTGEVIRFMGGDRNQVILGVGEILKVIKSGSVWYVIDERGQWDRVGEFIGWYANSKDNCIPLTGGEFDPTVYLRLADFVNSLDPALVVDYATYNSTTLINGETVSHKKGFFAKDVGTNKIKVPDLTGKHIKFLKNIGSSDSDRADNVAGGFQYPWVGAHKHVGFKAENAGHGGSSSQSTLPNLKLLITNAAGVVSNISQAETYEVNTGKENMVRNIGYIPLLLI